MGRKEEILEKVRGIAGPLAAQEGAELVDVEFGGGGGRQTLRIYIDKAGGVSLDDCSAVSRSVSAALDVEDPLEGSYDLEVSSPGLDRPLRTPEHFEKYKGAKVRVKTYAPVGDRKNFVGILKGFAEGHVVVDIDGKEFRVPQSAISKANLVAEPQFD